MLEIHAFKCPHGISAGGNEKTFHFLFPREKRIMGDCDFIFFLLFFFLLYKFFITNMYCFFLVLLFNIYFFQTLNFYSVLGSIANYQCCGSFRWTVKNICCFCDQKKKTFKKGCNAQKKNLYDHYSLTSVSDKHPITAMAFASQAVSKSEVNFELHLFSKS